MSTSSYMFSVEIDGISKGNKEKTSVYLDVADQLVRIAERIRKGSVGGGIGKDTEYRLRIDWEEVKNNNK